MQVANARQPFLLVFVFAVVCVLTSMALVYTKHESRKLFVELEGLTHERARVICRPIVGSEHANQYHLSVYSARSVK